jgi:hypothetical protein
VHSTHRTHSAEIETGRAESDTHIQRLGAPAECRPSATEVTRDSENTNERNPSLIGSLGLTCRYKRLLVCLGCSSRPSTKYIFPYRTQFRFLGPHRSASWANRQRGPPVSVCVSLGRIVPQSQGKQTAKTWFGLEK